MKKIELLSPVGDFECLKAAVQNGADAVYFGASNFNARASATNFDLSNLKDAITYAKLRGVNTHLTLNTLIKDSEFEEAVLLAQKAYEFGIDAIIVQDLGLARYLIKNFPDFPIHASTQMTIHNLEGVKELENLGFSRAVLSRELSLEEIEYICSHSGLEIETFIHGALCISYSGQCLFSSMIGGRSGNRGKCAGPCRLPYTLVSSEAEKTDETTNISKPNSYLLSTRDLCGLNFLPDLIKAGVMCFKIEGRMKAPDYVATVTRIYRKYIDLALSDKPYVVEQKDVEELTQVFNRGNFSDGHFSSNPNKELVFSKKPSNMGIYIGNVSNVKENKGHVFVNLTHSISLGDNITFENENTKYTISELMIKNKNIEKANNGMLVEIGRMKGNIKNGDKVYRIVSKELTEIAKKSYSEEHKKVGLSAHITLKENEPIVLNVKTNEDVIPIFKGIEASFSSSDTPVEAKSKPLSKYRIAEQLNKTGDTMFFFENIEVDLDDNLFLPSIKVLNELRRNALNEIYYTAQSKFLRTSPTLPDPNSDNKKIRNAQKYISVLLNILKEDENYEDLKGFKQIYIPLKYFSDTKYERALRTLSVRFDAYIYLPPIIKANYKNLLINIIDKSIDTYPIKGFVISNLSNFAYTEKLKKKYGGKFKFIGNYTLNVFNIQTENELKNIGIDEKFTISPELDRQTIESLISNSSSRHELIIYGRTPLMYMNYCLLGKTNKCYPTCGVHCKDEKQYYLKDRLGLNFRILPDNMQTVTTVYNSKITSIDGSEFKVSSYRVDILDENVEQINSIIENISAGKRFEGKEYTNGNLNREI